MNTPPLYTLEQVKFYYNRRFTLSVPDLSIGWNTSVGFVGPNGGGKTTLLKLLAFLETPHEGSIFFKGKRIGGDAAAVQRKVTMLLQEPYLLKRSVYENVSYGLKVRHETEHLRERVFRALELVGLAPGEFARRRWHELSGGEAQRVSLASRLVLEPEVLILDEPTASVDQKSALLIQEAIRTMRSRSRMSLIVASHDMAWLGEVADEVYTVRRGRISRSGPENSIEGPWSSRPDGLWEKTLGDGQRITAATPPETTAGTALLEPSDILVAVTPPGGLSARNVLRGTIVQMTRENSSEKLVVTVSVADLSLHCSVTRTATEELRLIPGNEVFVIFKAASIRWQ